METGVVIMVMSWLELVHSFPKKLVGQIDQAVVEDEDACRIDCIMVTTFPVVA